MTDDARDVIADFRALLDGEAPVIWTSGTVRRLVDVAEDCAGARLGLDHANAPICGCSSAS